jgi:nucleoside-diphosphate-sugar epimerase
MRTGLVGSTGFVGTTLQQQTSFDAAYHRPDIHEIAGRAFDLLVCAGAPAEKWRANQEPEADIANLEALVGHLGTAEADRLLLISTVDVYPTPVGVDEDTAIDRTEGGAYGRHRLWLEDRCRERFEHTCVVRLPGLFGPGLRKNLLFDLLGEREVNGHGDSRFQFYDMRRLWADLVVALDAGFDLVNFAVAPVTMRTVAEQCFGVPFPDADGASPASYDMRTRHAATFGGSGPYLVDEADELAAIADWVAAERAAR